mmetsp:Transcript_3688/g.6615  ORF Transcript_3688/g.6615 Transcript_3688/m.6615 type:complete len:90 (-) Transcript_3688:49-318(-)
MIPEKYAKICKPLHHETRAHVHKHAHTHTQTFITTPKPKIQRMNHKFPPGTESHPWHIAEQDHIQDGIGTPTKEKIRDLARERREKARA